MKLLFVTSHAGTGGDWVIIKTLVRHFVNKGLEVTIAGNIDDKEAISGTTRLQIPLNGGLGGLIRSTMALGPRRYSLIHAHNPVSALLSLLVSTTKSKIILTNHLQTNESPSKVLLKRWLYQRMNAIHCVSEESASWFATRYRLSPDKISIIHNGVSSAVFFPGRPEEKERARKVHGIPEDKVVLCFSGRLNPEKNLPLLLRYMAKNKHKGYVLLIAGDGPCRGELGRLVGASGIGDSVKFLGHLPCPRDAYIASDLMVLPSISETFSLVVIEAFMCGLPVLRSQGGGAIAQILPGVTGMLFDSRCEDEFDARLDGMLGNRPGLVAMGRTAHVHALKHFTQEQMCVRMENLYERVLGQVNGQML